MLLRQGFISVSRFFLALKYGNFVFYGFILLDYIFSSAIDSCITYYDNVNNVIIIIINIQPTVKVSCPVGYCTGIMSKCIYDIN